MPALDDDKGSALPPVSPAALAVLDDVLLRAALPDEAVDGALLLRTLRVLLLVLLRPAFLAALHLSPDMARLLARLLEGVD